jgi:hypothetical protein
MDKVVFDSESKANQKFPIFNVNYSRPVDYNIRFVVEWPDFEILSFPNRLPGKEDAEPSLVCKLQVQGMIDEGDLSLYQMHEATYLKKTLESLQAHYSNFLSATYPDFTFEMAPILSENSCMNVPVDIYKRAGKASMSSKTADIVAQYSNLESSKKLMCIRIGFAWMYPKEEDSTLSSFRAGIKYFLVAPQGKLSSSLKLNRSSGDTLILSSESAFVRPTKIC